MANQVKAKLSRGEVTVGHWLSFPSPSVAELMASFGMDWLVIDTEHGPAEYETVEDMIRAMRGTPVVPLVRVGGNDPVLIKKALDRGAYGVVVPLVNSPEEARAAVMACRYPPEGIRGVAGTRETRYGMDLRPYFESWNQDVLLVVQIETRQALERVEAVHRTQRPVGGAGVLPTVRSPGVQGRRGPHSQRGARSWHRGRVHGLRCGERAGEGSGGISVHRGG